jgi:hypothetical protein
MAAKTKIKKDSLGLYVNCGGWISRPFYGTCFVEGEEVKAHHFGGSTDAGVTSPDKPETHNFKRNGQYELWVTTSVMASDYDKKIVPSGNAYSNFPTFDDYLNHVTNWSKDNKRGALLKIHTDRNKKFSK